MRSETEMMELILDTARNDDRIRAVWMNGSRTNKNAKKDIFQDYDIVYAVRETRPFYEDVHWIDHFGEQLYMQCPDEVDRVLGLPVDFDKCYGWLIQFTDGVRLDLHVVPVSEADVTGDRLCVVLLDKDGILPELPSPSDEDYHIRRPSQEQFAACCNEFWWCLNNVAKGLWRREIPYVQSVYYDACHPRLVQMLNWKIGYETDFSVSTGKASKYMDHYLPADIWQRFLKTYISGEIHAIWDSVFTMCDLFDETAGQLETRWGHMYNRQEAAASYGFLIRVRWLPEDATEI